MTFFPKDQKIKSVLDRLVQDRACETDFNTAKQLSRYKQIRAIRNKDELYIGMDRKMGKSVLFAKKPIKKKGNGFIL
jgi:hypothetical protein